MRAKLSNQQRKKRENQMIIALIHVSCSSYIIINIVSISISEVWSLNEKSCDHIPMEWYKLIDYYVNFNHRLLWYIL